MDVLREPRSGPKVTQETWTDPEIRELEQRIMQWPIEKVRAFLNDLGIPAQLAGYEKAMREEAWMKLARHLEQANKLTILQTLHQYDKA